MSPINSILSKVHQEKCTYFLTLYCCLWHVAPLVTPLEVLVGQSKIQWETTTSTGINSKATLSHTRDAVGNGCTSEKYFAPSTDPHRICFMGMMNELAVSHNSQPNDKVKFQNATVTRDDSARLRPGYWIFVRPGSEKNLAVRQVGHSG